MTVNVSTRRFDLTINGVDCSNLMRLFDVGDNLEDGSGLSICTGQIVLAGDRRINLDLDDWNNEAQWARGNLIVFDQADSTNTLRRHPRGNLRILKSAYDPFKRVLTLSVGDELALRAAEAPPGDSSGVKLGEYSSRSQIINALLVKAGAPSLYDGIGEYPINYPLPLVTGSYIQQAGAIAHAAGYILWSDNLGRTRAKKIALGDDVPLLIYRVVGENELRYERSTGVEAPAQKVRCCGTVYQAIAPITVREDQWELRDLVGNYAPSSPVAAATMTIKRFRERETIDRIARRRIVETWEEAIVCATMPHYYPDNLAFVPSGYRKETHSYELPIDNPTGLINPNNQQRLLKVEIEEQKQRGVTLKSYYDKHTAERDIQISSNGMWSLVVDSREVQRWTYYDLSVLKFGKVIQYSQELFRILPALVADLDSVAFPSAPLTDERLCEKSSTLWEKLTPRKWRQSDTAYQSAILTNPESLKKQTPAATLAGKLALREVPGQNLTRTSTSGQINPPSPEHFPEGSETSEQSAKGEVKLKPRAGTYQERLKTYTIDYLTGQTEADELDPNGRGPAVLQLEELARIKAGILTGRFRGHTWACEFDDAFFDWEPLSGIAFQEQTSSFAVKDLMDGCAWTTTQRRSLVGGQGISLGKIMGSNGTPFLHPYTPSSPSPNLATVAARPTLPPYVPIAEVEVGLGIGVEVVERSPGVVVAELTWETLTEAQWIALTEAQWIDMGPPVGVKLGLGLGVEFVGV